MVVAPVDNPAQRAGLQGASGKNQINAAGVRAIINPLHLDLVFVERAQVMPSVRGNRTMGAVSSFNYGVGFGVLLGLIVGLQRPMTLVPPVDWKRVMRVTKDKDAARARAMQLFPKSAGEFARKKDDGRAEAALIAMYGTRQLGGAA